MNHVVPLGRFEIDHNTFLASAQEALGRNISRGIDSEGISISSPLGYLKALQEIKSAGSTLNHSFYAMMAVCDFDTLFELMEQTPLHIHSEPTVKRGLHFAIVSGTLAQWREAIINTLHEGTSFELRVLMDKCMLIMEKDGLQELWKNYKKVNLNDQSFKLLPK